MNFRDYKWFRNPRGLHNIAVFRGIDSNRYTGTHMGWAKMVAGDAEYLGLLTELLSHECMGIVRIFRENMGAMRVPDDWYDRIYKRYIDAGILWFELYNEPNLEGEWPRTGSGSGPNVWVSYDNVDDVVVPMMDNWLEWAEKIIELGGYPGFPAMSDSADHRHSTIYWLDAFLGYLRVRHNSRMRRVIANGLWCATHPYIANHFYQEPPGGPASQARPYDQERANEGGWHFEYPYDPLQQSHDPGRTVFGGTSLTPNGDPNGLVASGRAFQALLKKHFDAGPVPTVGTEGGIWKIPGKDDTPHLIDTRYPPYSLNSHAEATMAMWKWIAQQGPPWFWGLTLWNESDYFDIQGEVPATQRMKAEPPILKNVPSIDTGGGSFWEAVPDLPSSHLDFGSTSSPVGSAPQPTAEAEEDVPVAPTPQPGPGEVDGQPDLHWLVLAPGLQADWFFQAARRYWQTFRPVVLTDWNLIEQVPHYRSLAITVLTRTDTISYMNEQIRDAWPNVFYDPITFDNLDEMMFELDRRATEQNRFG